MRVIDKRTVSLSENESEVLERFDMWLDKGYGIVESAERALLGFWYDYPGAENDRGTPFTWQFFWWMICGNGDDLMPDHHGWPKFWRNRSGLLRFMNLHTEALTELMESADDHTNWGTEEHEEAWEEAYYRVQFIR